MPHIENSHVCTAYWNEWMKLPLAGGHSLETREGQGDRDLSTSVIYLWHLDPMAYGREGRAGKSLL